MPDGFAFTFRGVDGVLREYVFEPATDGGHIRIDYRQMAGEWVPVGREPVEDVNLECANSVATGE
ncbi:hypothetical protein [Natrinema salaciae]|uniref:Uncharacterized protein n=1 Tax=Natrinema salaciae TaxID=1186196 RepID=A0A1H9ETX6_9EURY|nr:hypothetical protein [Natrinema salaciae]SEQ29095.1 hypothetical protein SAMN04489841_1381 [Natrinema salaciae]